MPTTADTIATLALVVSAISASIGIYNFFHANRLFRQANYPKLDVSFLQHDNTPRTINTHFTIYATNTHSTTLITNLCIHFDVYRRIWKFNGIFPKFSVETHCGDLNPRSSAIYSTLDTETKDLTPLIAKAFPNMLTTESDESIKTKGIDGASAEEVPTEEYYFRVKHETEMLVKVIATYQLGIHKSKPQKDVWRFIIKPKYKRGDKDRGFTGWEIQQL